MGITKKYCLEYIPYKGYQYREMSGDKFYDPSYGWCQLPSNAKIVKIVEIEVIEE